MQLLKDILHLFYPNLCSICDKTLLKNETVVCITCNHDLPIHYKKNLKQSVSSVFYGRIPVERAIAFLTFKKGNKTQRLIHELKYNNNQQIGRFLGDWFGNELRNEHEFTNVDYIVPVPLHPKKLKARGYNQVTTFGKRLSEKLQIPYKENVLQRISLTETQTLRQRFERFTNTNTTFQLTDLTIFENKHILLIDDVITTGATIEACCNALLKTNNISLSVAAMAYTEKE